jgi:predicted P-loop ATPase/GTPase
VKPISGVVCWSQYNWLKRPVMSDLKIRMSVFVDHFHAGICPIRG